jgi:hypothetical protein
VHNALALHPETYDHLKDVEIFRQIQPNFECQSEHSHKVDELDTHLLTATFAPSPKFSHVIFEWCFMLVCKVSSLLLEPGRFWS